MVRTPPASPVGRLSGSFRPAASSRPKKNPGPDRHRAHQHTLLRRIMSFVPAPDLSEGNDHVQVDSSPVPPLRWIMVGYFFWVGIFLGALIMRSATGF
jgi:hypothetical protein